MGRPDMPRINRERRARLEAKESAFQKEKARRSFGTPLTDFGIKKRKLETNLSKLERSKPGPQRGLKKERRSFKEIDEIIGQQVSTPTLLADPKKIDRKKKRDRLRGGRLSTLLSNETLG